jgi:hypothetical protein
MIAEAMELGYRKAQRDIAKRMVLNECNDSFIQEMTQLTKEDVLKVRFDSSLQLRRIIQNMLKEKVSENKIALMLEVPIEIVNEVKGRLTE